MKVLVIGAAGMLGRKFNEKLVKTGLLAGRKVSRLTMADVITPASPADAPFEVDLVACDLSAPAAAESLIANRPDFIFHLAAIVSGEAEADFEKGYRINLDGTRHLFEAVRRAGYNPRLVFTSSIAVFGAPFPEVIGEEFFLTPLTSYGTQKAIGELLLADYTRRGFFDGISIRLPTICVRPGKPNLAASGFYSNIIREPLKGEQAVLPVSDDVRHWFASPRSAINFL
ncbi:MAG: NAD-dependent epimerase/dehydratase family protein, partial [Verrucomicrobia bacterium]|nr:NAD-dependent epimerase/dehydratase family protein [Verrucomicrobiota bacterium]